MRSKVIWICVIQCVRGEEKIWREFWEKARKRKKKTKKNQRGGDGERLLCFLPEEEGILSRGVMSTTASIYTLHLHGNMTLSFHHLETEKEMVDLN